MQICSSTCCYSLIFCYTLGFIIQKDISDFPTTSLFAYWLIRQIEIKMITVWHDKTLSDCILAGQGHFYYTDTLSVMNMI